MLLLAFFSFAAVAAEPQYSPKVYRAKVDTQLSVKDGWFAYKKVAATKEVSMTIVKTTGKTAPLYVVELVAETSVGNEVVKTDKMQLSGNALKDLRGHEWHGGDTLAFRSQLLSIASVNDNGSIDISLTEVYTFHSKHGSHAVQHEVKDKPKTFHLD